MKTIKKMELAKNEIESNEEYIALFEGDFSAESMEIVEELEKINSRIRKELAESGVFVV